MSAVNQFGRLKSYIDEARPIDATEDPIRASIFGQQMEATTRSLRSFAIVMAAILFAIPPLFWGSAYRPLLVAGTMVICLTGVYAARKIPRRVKPSRIRDAMRRHLIAAFAFGTGWSLLMAGLATAADEQTLLLVVAFEVAAICVGLILYINLPLVFVTFTVPIMLPATLTFAFLHDDKMLLAVFVPLFVGLLARSSLEQSRMFVASGRVSERLRQSEDGKRAAERDAEEAMRATERDAADVQVCEAEARIEAVRRSEASRREGLLELAKRFETEVMVVVDTLSDAVGQLGTSTIPLMAMTHNAVAAADDIASRSSRTSRSTEKLARAASHLSSAIVAINDQIVHHATLSDHARSLVQRNEASVAAMNDEAKQVGGVITIIEGITAQTGLLALNATIEAARAGDAGRGFAVVAEEVSSLSKRAAHATRDITGQIQLIASKVGSVVEGMKDTGGRIDDVAQVATTIAGAIAEQRAAAEDIRQEVLSLATHADDVRDRMSGLADAADAAQTLMGGVANTADRVNSQAASLKQVTSLFLSSIRAA